MFSPSLITPLGKVATVNDQFPPPPAVVVACWTSSINIVILAPAVAVPLIVVSVSITVAGEKTGGVEVVPPGQ